MIRVFKNWHTESDTGKEVVLIEFLGYTRHNGYPVTYVDKETQQKYYGAQYTALLFNGTYSTVTIKEFIDDEEADSEVPWSYNKNPIRDDIPYYHNDSDAELLAGKIFLSNREKINPRLARAIQEGEDFKQKLISLINDIKNPKLKKGFTLYLFFYNSPSYATKKVFKSWCSINQEEFLIFKQLLEWD